MHEEELETALPDDLESLEKINGVCEQFESAWQSGDTPNIADYLTDFAGHSRKLLFQYLLELDVDYRKKQGDADPTVDDYLDSFPDLKESITMVFRGDDESSTDQSS